MNDARPGHPAERPQGGLREPPLPAHPAPAGGPATVAPAIEIPIQHAWPVGEGVRRAPPRRARRTAWQGNAQARRGDALRIGVDADRLQPRSARGPRLVEPDGDGGKDPERRSGRRSTDDRGEQPGWNQDDHGGRQQRRQGHLGYRAAREPGVSRRLFQEAPRGFVLDVVRGDEVVRVDGMHADRPSIEFTLPGPPSIEFVLEGHRVPAAPRTHTIVVEPAVERVSLVYGATVELPRTFIPGIHKHIPVAVTIDGDRPIHYEAPPTVRERMASRDAPRERT
ncbi:DUF2169 domain-containing protein [Sorangium sp. So ce1097]|uniref:DUF2169 domain-containing protein n=1 Tax=Sorangium sp. So ce1097 TaxID=3133330 RepID=UPI003F61377F